MSPRQRNTSPLFERDVGLRVNACRKRLRRIRSRRISSTPVERDATGSESARSNDAGAPGDPGPSPSAAVAGNDSLELQPDGKE
ncbi:MAG TPA: hypothetical protein VGJ55_13595 [Pyrinomonadaceae bacterium]|jgi:hypothetical protein